MKKILLTAILFLTPSCGLFSSPDPTPALMTLEQIDNEFLDTLDSFKDVINGSTLSADLKAQIITKIDEVSAKREESVKALREFLLSLGDVDLAMWAEKLYVDYKALRQRLRESK